MPKTAPGAEKALKNSNEWMNDTGTEIRLLCARDWGWGREMGVTANGCMVSFWGDENVLELDSGDGCTTLWTH